MTNRSDPLPRVASFLVALALALALALPSLAHAQTPAPATAPDPDLDVLRERFKDGMDDYRAGRYGDAILKWEKIRAELGDEKGYRLVFNIARAYDALGDLAAAATRYETYIAEVRERQRDPVGVEANVAKQAEEAAERLAEIGRSLVRLHVDPRGSVAQLDDERQAHTQPFVAYVAPGAHRVTFGTGEDAETRAIDARLGEPLELAPTPKPPPVAPLPPPPPPPVRYEARTDRPFSPTFLWIAGGVTVVSLVIPIVAYADALSKKSDFDRTNPRTPTTSSADQVQTLGSQAASYNDARSTFYVSLIVPGALALGTGALAAWYALGAKEIQVPVTPEASFSKSGATLRLTTTF